MLSKMKVGELRKVAEEMGVDHSESKTKAALVAQLAEEGVTDQSYQEYLDSIIEPVEPEEETVQPVKKTPKVNVGDEVLVKMNRANPTFEIRGYRFTKDHPYIAMNQNDAQEIFDFDPRGFAIATPNEVKEYYS